MRNIIIMVLLLSCGIITCCAEEPESKEIEIKQGCIKATLKAIELEIKRYEAGLKSTKDIEKTANLKKSLSRLTEEKKNYQTIKHGDYSLPKKLLLTGRYEGQILHEGRSRSGPFYHVATSAPTLKKGKKYEFEGYRVYRRPYPNGIRSYYVYISKAKRKFF